MRPSSAVRILLASAPLVGFGAALCTFVLWVVLFIGEARILEQDFGITPATLALDAIMVALAVVWASLRSAALLLVVISFLSFVPVGLYALLLGDYGTWIGVRARLARVERHGAVG
ncbi:MAG TPA: hypothetical protein VJ827_09660 [Rubrobacter sp.]|nr:hypothetical protein [Rubrobacter sp.]